MKTIILICTAILIIFQNFSYSQMLSFQYQGVQRKYLLHVPASYKTGSPMPLILAFHGYTETPAQMEGYSRLSIKSDSSGFIVAYADTWSPTSYWNTTLSGGDVGFVNALIDTLIKTYSIDTTKIYATGFSSGSMFTYCLAYSLPNKFAAIAPVTGYLSGIKVVAARPVPTIYFHALNDTMIPYSGVSSAINYWCAQNRGSITPDTILYNHDVTGKRWAGKVLNTEFILYSTTTGAHSWPGSSSGSKAISATDLMLDFFNKHTLNIPDGFIYSNFIVSPAEGPDSLLAAFSTDIISDPKIKNITWEWDFNNDGKIESTEQNPTWLFKSGEKKSFDVKLITSCGIYKDTLVKKAVVSLAGKVPVLSVDQAQIKLGKVDVNLSKIDTSFIIQNTGSLEDSVSITISTSANVNSYAFNQNTVSLLPQSSKHINITIYPPVLGPDVNAAYTFTITSKFGYGKTVFYKVITLSTSGATAVEKTGYLPDRYELKQNYPNPFNPSTCISYDLPEEAKVEISIYNLLGEKVNVLFTGTQRKGNHIINWNAAGFTSGIYFCRIKAEGKISFDKTRKLVLLK